MSIKIEEKRIVVEGGELWALGKNVLDLSNSSKAVIRADDIVVKYQGEVFLDTDRRPGSRVTFNKDGSWKYEGNISAVHCPDIPKDLWIAPGYWVKVVYYPPHDDQPQWVEIIPKWVLEK
jgi:hypothetical protein